uniref:Uncharacterized protein n=1 Tax=Spongospora subterranea TaxID=70186 RepID=A0A0H5RNQ4_9EUKA|eukprot:CRZ10359.1 hypothetical protein [Spongospora subterranea]
MRGPDDEWDDVASIVLQCRDRWQALNQQGIRHCTDFVNNMFLLEEIYFSPDRSSRELDESKLQMSSLQIEGRIQDVLSKMRIVFIRLRSGIEVVQQRRHVLYNEGGCQLLRMHGLGSWTIDDLVHELYELLNMFARELVSKASFVNCISRGRGCPSTRFSHEQWHVQLSVWLFEPFLCPIRLGRITNALTNRLKSRGHR